MTAFGACPLGRQTGLDTRCIESGKVAGSQHEAEGGAFLRTGWEAPRYNLSWGWKAA